MNKVDLEHYKGVIFDLDGVIFDVIKPIKAAVDDGLKKYDIKTDINLALEEIAHLLEDLQNYPIPKIILNSYNFLKIKLFDGISFLKKLRIAIFIFNQFNKYKEEAVLFEGIESIISKLHEKKLKLSILTNNKNTYAEDILKKFNLNKYFELIIGFNEVEGKVKPNPEGLLKILEKWNLKASNVLFIGDMVTDIVASKAANIKIISVASGLALKENLTKNNPDYLIENVKELKELFNL